MDRGPEAKRSGMFWSGEQRRELSGQVLEEQGDYEAAVATISAAKYISTEFTIVSGVRKVRAPYSGVRQYVKLTVEYSGVHLLGPGATY